MNIKLDCKLRTLRKEKGVTQEDLANHLGITSQSVGKWERGEGFPDITLLPKIAFYFDITVDELLCVDKIRIDESIEAYAKQSRLYAQDGDNEARIQLWEDAYKKFPNDCRVIQELMYAKMNGPDENATGVIPLGEMLLHKTTDSRQRETAIQCLCYAYNIIGNKEKALTYADMCGSIHMTRETFRTTILTGEDGVEACQSYIAALIRSAAMTATCMTTKQAFSPEEIIEVHQFAIDILTRLFADGNVGFYAYDLSFFWRNIAIQQIKLMNIEQTMTALSESCRYAIMDATLENINYTAPMVNRLRHKKENVAKNFTGNSCNLRLNDLKDACFDFVRNESGFKTMITELEKYAL